MLSNFLNMPQTSFIFFKTLFFFFTLTPIFGKNPNLKQIISEDPICQTIEITIPDFPNAYNPSIIPYNDGYLISFRYACRLPQWTSDKTLLGIASFIGLATLDKQFQVKKNSVQLLEIQTYSDDFSIYAEDARIFTFQNQIYLLFNDFPSPSPEFIRRHYVVEITNENQRWTCKNHAIPLILENQNRIEKNWVPFCINDSLYLIYGEDPHTILQCNIDTGYCRKINETTVDLHWPYGIIRGGTPALKVGKQFITFFHSSTETPSIYNKRIYFMGAYTFDPYFPFSIRAITPSPIGLNQYYQESSSSKKRSKKVVFPGGFVREGSMIHIAWGKDDRKVMITTVDLEKILKELIEID